MRVIHVGIHQVTNGVQMDPTRGQISWLRLRGGSTNSTRFYFLASKMVILSLLEPSFISSSDNRLNDALT